MLTYIYTCPKRKPLPDVTDATQSVDAACKTLTSEEMPPALLPFGEKYQANSNAKRVTAKTQHFQMKRRKQGALISCLGTQLFPPRITLCQVVAISLSLSLSGYSNTLLLIDVFTVCSPNMLGSSHKKMSVYSVKPHAVFTYSHVQTLRHQT